MRRVDLGSILTYAYLIGSSLLLVYPLLFMLGGSFTTLDQYYRTWFIPIPTRPTLHAYEVILRSGLEQAIRITLLRVAWYLGLTLLVSLFGGYVFSRLRFPGKSLLFLFFLSGLAIPAILTSLPTYMLLARWPLARETRRSHCP